MLEGMSLMQIMIIIFSCFISGFVVWLLCRSAMANKTAVIKDRLQEQLSVVLELQNRIKLLQSDKELLIRQTTQAESQLEFLNEQYTFSKRYQKENELMQNQLAMFKAKYHAAEEKLETQKQEIESLGNRFKFEFRNLAQSILDEKTEKFTLVNEEKMNAILNPLKAQLGEFKQKVEETYDRESKERFSLGREIEKLVQMSQLVSTEANSLTNALKGNNKTQGNWGEMILESLLEHSGLSRGREYQVQEFIRDNAGNVIKDENGRALQPDITIYYPDQRRLVIDSKVSLVAWEQFVSCTETDSRKKCLEEHLRSIRSHIEALSRKNYPRYAQALDYVLLFVPIEPAFLEAVKSDLQLWKYAYDKKILLVSPTNLFAVLKIVADLWRVEQQNRHAIAIADKAGSLYDKVAGFVENLETVGRRISEAQQAHEIALRQLSSGKGNIINKVEELKKMGANAQKQLPERLLSDVAEENAYDQE
jgi:DNA recombination protein RmuC